MAWCVVRIGKKNNNWNKIDFDREMKICVRKIHSGTSVRRT